jgi:hypothetical protein
MNGHLGARFAGAASGREASRRCMYHDDADSRATMANGEDHANSSFQLAPRWHMAKENPLYRFYCIKPIGTTPEGASQIPVCVCVCVCVHVRSVCVWSGRPHSPGPPKQTTAKSQKVCLGFLPYVSHQGSFRPAGRNGPEGWRNGTAQVAVPPGFPEK